MFTFKITDFVIAQLLRLFIEYLQEHRLTSVTGRAFIKVQFKKLCWPGLLAAAMQ